MSFFTPKLPPYSSEVWRNAILDERAQLCTTSWATQGYGTPLSAYAFYIIKLALYVWGWLFFSSLSPALGSWETLPDWWLHPLAFEKAILWSMLFEVLGLGCGSGPLTGRYLPPLGGFLYFLRPGTLKAPLVDGLPLIGKPTRGLLDVGVYAGLLLALVVALVTPEHQANLLWPIVGLCGVLGFLDRSAFLASRPEHYLIMTFGFALEGHALSAALWIQLALWFWAGVSKLNPHFPTVVGVMVSNSPALAFPWFRKLMYRAYPSDLRPSGLAKVLAHFGTVLELGIPIAMLAGFFEPALVPIGLVMVIMLHAYIVSNVPMGVPNEWNFAVAYGAFVVFMPETARQTWTIESPLLLMAVLLVGFVVPLIGNLKPERVSFLLAMRYYAGNWPYSIWLFRGEAYRKLDALKGSSGWLSDQLSVLYDEDVIEAVKSRIMAFRLMHLQGRILPTILHRAVSDIRAYEYMEGEVIAGMTLGWNFGDGHLHHEPLLTKIQDVLKFDEGDLVVVMVEPQSLAGTTMSFRVVDAALGERFRGSVDIATLEKLQPWESLPAEEIRVHQAQR